MVVAVFLVVAVVFVVVLAVFLRAVFGGSGMPRQRGRTPKEKGDDGRGPRPDAHAGASSWPGAGGFGRWGTWSGDT